MKLRPDHYLAPAHSPPRYAATLREFREKCITLMGAPRPLRTRSGRALSRREIERLRRLNVIVNRHGILTAVAPPLAAAADRPATTEFFHPARLSGVPR